MYLSDALMLRATCSLCNNSFDISNMGERAVGSKQYVTCLGKSKFAHGGERNIFYANAEHHRFLT